MMSLGEGIKAIRDNQRIIHYRVAFSAIYALGLPKPYEGHFMDYVCGVKGKNMINNKIFVAVENGVRIYYPDGVIRFFSNSWEGEMFI